MVEDISGGKSREKTGNEIEKKIRKRIKEMVRQKSREEYLRDITPR